MRTEIQAEQVRIVTATIFNRLRLDAEPAGDFNELTGEESTEEDRQRWKAIEEAVSSGDRDDVMDCRAIFKDWTPSPEQVWAARRRIHPVPTGVATPRGASCQ
jgi:hypothetical protein